MPLIRVIALGLLLSVAAPVAAGAGYRLDLELDAAAPFPFLSKFGSVRIAVYPDGVSARAAILRGFTRNGSADLTVLNPLGRMYVQIPLETLPSMIHKVSGSEGAVMPELREFPISAPVAGKVLGLEARRYRVQLGKEAYIDVWTTTAIPPNPQYIRVARGFADAISPAAGALARKIDGMPVYIEMNTRRFKKLPLLRLTEFSQSSAGAEDALRIGSLYVKAPGSDFLFK